MMVVVHTDEGDCHTYSPARASVSFFGRLYVYGEKAGECIAEWDPTHWEKVEVSK